MCYFGLAYFYACCRRKKRNSKYRKGRLVSNLKEKVINEIKKVYDPEIPVNIYELGLIYKLEINDKNVVDVDMTLTTPNCPVADSLPKQVKEYILKVKGVSDVKLNLVWDPPWDKSKMSEAAKLELNIWANKL